MTDVHENHDELFDIMQLIESSIPKYVAGSKSDIIIKPDVARIKKALATPGEIDALLSKHIEKYLRVTGVDDYITQYAIKKLINETPDDTVYNGFFYYKERIISRLHLSILMHTEHISVSKRLGPHIKKILLAHKFWSRLSDEQKRQRCCSIMISEDRETPTFIDLSFFYRRSRPTKKDQTDWEHDYDDEYGVASFDECCFMGQQAGLPGRIDAQLTVEEVVMACTDHIAQRDLNLEMSDTQAAEEMLGFMLTRIETKNSRNKKRIVSLIDGITITTLLHRAKAKNGQGYPKPNLISPVRLSVSQLPLFMMDLILNALLTTKMRRQIIALPEGEQRAHLKYHIQGLTLHNAIKVLNHANIKEMGFQLPFIVDLTKLTAAIRKKIKEEIALNDTDYTKLNTTALSALKRFRTMSELDRKMLIGMEQRRFMYLLRIEKERYQMRDGVPSDKLDALRASRFFADLYLLASDAGIRVTKLRNLVKMVYHSYLPAVTETEEFSSRNTAAHDILTNYESHFMTFLKGWNPSPRFHPILNRIIDLLISQLGGAQGNLHKAFSSWGRLPTLVGKELSLLDGQPKNMDEVFLLTRIDKNYIRKATPLLNQLLPSVVSQDQLHQYASNSVGNEAFYHYLNSLGEARERLDKKLAPLVPALRCAKQVSLGGGLCLDILPYDDVLGALGVSAQGVCIRFRDSFHLQHQNPAVANLIIRDENKIWLWGLLIRAQNTKTPTYILNNFQGAFPSRYAKHKEKIRKAIRQALSELGTVYSLDFYFNAIRLLSEEEKTVRHRGQVVVPSMRLDVRDTGAVGDDFAHPNREGFMSVKLYGMSKITAN